MPNGAGSTAAVRRHERRRCVRRKVLANGEMIPVDLGPMESGLLLDICARGASVQGLKPLRPGVRISLKFRLPGSEVSVQPTYEVIWADRNGRIGLKFLYIAEREQRLLDEWATQYFPQAVPEPDAEPSRPPDSIADSTTPAAMTLDQELARVVEQASGYTFAEGGAIALREEQGIVCRASWGNAPDIGVLLNPDSGLSGECIRTGASVHCADALSDPRVDPVAARQLNLRSALIVPIKIDDAVQGLIEVLSSRPSAFTPAHLTSLERLAEIVGFLTGPPIVPPPERPIKAAECAPGERAPSAATPPPEPEPAPVPEVRSSGIESEPAPIPASADAALAVDTNDVAGIIQLIEPELKPAPITVEERAAAPDETVAPDVESAPDEPAVVAELSSATVPLASFEEPHRELRVSIFAAVVLVCGILLAGMWFLGPRWVSKGTPHPATPPAAATPQVAVTSQPSVSPPVAAVEAPARAAATSRSKPKKRGPASTASSTAPSEEDDVKVVTWVEGGNLSAQQTTGAVTEPPPSVASVPASGLPQIPAATPVAPVRAAEPGSSPLHVTPQVMLDRIISRPSPEYPEEARRAKIDGVVTLKVIVGTDGRVEMAAPISGPAILGVAAAKAVSQWRYRPYLRDGKPVRVETTVTVGFRRG